MLIILAVLLFLALVAITYLTLQTFALKKEMKEQEKFWNDVCSDKASALLDTEEELDWACTMLRKTELKLEGAKRVIAEDQKTLWNMECSIVALHKEIKSYEDLPEIEAKLIELEGRVRKLDIRQDNIDEMAEGLHELKKIENYANGEGDTPLF